MLQTSQTINRVQDIVFLDMDPTTGRPEDMILTYIPVPPCCIRPSVATGLASNQDDLTMKIKEIIQVDSNIRASMKGGHAIESPYSVSPLK